MFKKRLANNRRFLLPTVIIGAILLRFYLSSWPPHTYDMKTFHAWSINMLASGPSKFFDNTWTDYLPLPLYFLSLIKLLSSFLHTAFPITLKFTTSLIEIFLSIFIVKQLPRKTRPLTLALLLFSPAFLINTSIWGQIDAIPTLLTLLALLAYSRAPFSSSILYGLAVSIKPITLLALPFFILNSLKKKQFLRFSLTSFTVFLLTALPVVMRDIHTPIDLISQPFKFLLGQSKYQASVYPYTTINAFNYWSLRSSNWLSDQRQILGINARSFSLIIFSLLVFPLAKKMKNISIHNSLKLTGLIFLLFYTFTTRMHERHMMFGIPFLLLASLRDKWLIVPYFILSFTYALNLESALYWVNNSQAWPLTKQSIIGISFVNLITVLTIYLSIFKRTLSKATQFIRNNRSILLICVMAFLLRTINLSSPSKMIFDEVYHAFTAKEMIANNPAAWEWWNTPPEGFAYEWTHPPLAKYGMVAGMLVFGENAFGWRFFSAVMGTFSIYLIYLFTLKLFKSRRVALLAAGLLSIEGIHLVQSRVAMNDIYLLTFLLLTFYFALTSKWKQTALALGFALSSKWSALYAFIPLAFIYLSQYKLSLKSALNALRYLLIALITYILLYLPFFTSGHDHIQFIELHRQMWHYHTNLVASHAYQSVPLQWIFSVRPVWYFVEYANTTRANIYSLANPAIAWAGLISLIVALHRKTKNTFILLILYLIFILPWIFSPRIMFNYHYLPSLTFLTIFLALWLSSLRNKKLYLALSIFILTFILLSPFYYGIHAPLSYWENIFRFMPTWK